MEIKLVQIPSPPAGLVIEPEHTSAIKNFLPGDLHVPLPNAVNAVVL